MSALLCVRDCRGFPPKQAETRTSRDDGPISDSARGYGTPLPRGYGPPVVGPRQPLRCTDAPPWPEKTQAREVRPWAKQRVSRRLPCAHLVDQSIKNDESRFARTS